MIGHRQNPVPGLEPRMTTEALYRVSGFFMRSARPHSNYGGACRGTERCAGSFVAGSSNPVRLTTSEIGTSGGD
nr:MAG TPA: Ash protein family protein [Caudoviricetes sp.]DAW21020.1 MAG TPA: Ash protein family protein [Caudoviricetes sp.]